MSETQSEKKSENQRSSLFDELQQYASIQYAAADQNQQSHLMALRNTIAHAAIQVQKDNSLTDSDKTPAMMSALTNVLVGDTEKSPPGMSELATSYLNRNEGEHHVRSAMNFREPNLVNFAGDSGFSQQYHDIGKAEFRPNML